MGSDSQEYTDKYTAQVLMDQDMKRDLQWWTTMELWSLGTSICTHSLPALVLESDAFRNGWGAQCMETSTVGAWSFTEAQFHINYLELLAVFLALKTFVNNQKGLILLKMDNVSAVMYINKKGGTHSTQWCNLALQIWEWLVYPKQDNATGRTPAAWQSQHSGRHRIPDGQGPMQLDDQPKSVPTITTVTGSTRDRPLCNLTD